jgi:hypothetical protein
MDGISLAQLSRIMLHGTVLVLGSLGVFCLYCSYFGAHLAQYAIFCLGTATGIIMARIAKSGRGAKSTATTTGSVPSAFSEGVALY